MGGTEEIINKDVADEICNELNCLQEAIGEAVRACSMAIAEKLIASNADSTDAAQVRRCLEAAGCAGILRSLDANPFGSGEVVADVVACISELRNER